MDSITAPSPALQLKAWIRLARRKAGLTQPQLARRIDVASKEVFRWEHLSCSDLPDTAQLARLADAVQGLPPTLPDGLLASPPPREANPPSTADAAPGARAAVPDGPITDVAALKRWIRRVRKQARLTQATLAGLLDVNPVTAHKWEHPDAPDRPPWRAIGQIADACKVALPDIDAGLALRGRPVAPLPPDPETPPAGTLMEEIGQAAARLARRYDGRDTQARNAALFVDYYGRGHTLQTVGEAYGLTRERVRQVVARLLESVPVRPPPREKFAELAARCAALSPMPVAQAEAALADVLGGVSLPAAVTYGAHVLGEGLPIEIDTEQAVPMVLPRGLPNWVAAALRHARRMIRFNGAALFDQVWAATQAGHPVQVTPEALATALQAVYGFAWLDPTNQWFWFGPDDGANRILDWARRVLATAGRRVDVEHVHAGLARFTALYDETSRTTAIMPTPQVLLAMLASCPDIEVKQGDDLKLLDTSLVPATEPGSILEQLVELLTTHGGAMARGEIYESLVEGRGIVPISLSVQLATSPVIRRLDYGIYAIRGWQMTPETAARAWRANQSNAGIDVAYGADSSLAWDLTLSEAAIANDRLYLPQGASRQIPAGPYAVRGGGAVRVVGAAQHAQLRGLGAVAAAMGGVAGDRFRITVWPTQREIELEPI